MGRKEACEAREDPEGPESGEKQASDESHDSDELVEWCQDHALFGVIGTLCERNFNEAGVEGGEECLEEVEADTGGRKGQGVRSKIVSREVSGKAGQNHSCQGQEGG